MERSSVRKTGLLPSLIVSLFLLTATVGAKNAEATTTTTQPNGVQLAWWGGGGYYHGGYYRGGYFNSGYRPYYRGGCQKNCWRDRWGNVRCATRCY